MNETGPEQLCHAIATLRASGVVAFPTETVYGLGALAYHEDAVRRVFELKGRREDNPLIVHVSGIAMAREVTSEWPALAEALAEAFWPGPLTIVLPKRERVPSVVTAAGKTVGVRAPDHHLALSLIDALGAPIVGPSANRSGGVSPTTAKHVRAEFNESEVLVLDGGPCRRGIESTVVRLEGDAVEILRLGVIGPEQIERATGASVKALTSADDLRAHAPLESPGLIGPHYQPRTRAVLVDAEDLASLLNTAPGPVCLVTTGDPPGSKAHSHVLLPADAEGYARRLYAALREADQAGAQLIAIVRPPTQGDSPDVTAIWRAVTDRLSRATTG